MAGLFVEQYGAARMVSGMFWICSVPVVLNSQSLGGRAVMAPHARFPWPSESVRCKLINVCQDNMGLCLWPSFLHFRASASSRRQAA